MLGGEALVDRAECSRIVGAEIGRRAHAGEQRPRARFADSRQDRVEIGLHPVRGQAAQAVVGAELDDHDLRRIGERPVEPRQPAGAGVARDPGIDHPPPVTRRPERAFEPRREGVFARKSIARRQAVAENDDLGLPGGNRGAEKQEPRAEDDSDPRYCTAGGAAR